MFSFYHLVIISSKYISNSPDEKEEPWRNPLLISTSFDSLELDFINVGLLLLLVVVVVVVVVVLVIVLVVVVLVIVVLIVIVVVLLVS